MKRRDFLKQAATGAAFAGAAGAVVAGSVAGTAFAADSDLMGLTGGIDADALDFDALAALETQTTNWTIKDDSWFPTFREGQRLLIDDKGPINDQGYYLIEQGGETRLTKAEAGPNPAGIYRVEVSWDLWGYNKEVFGAHDAPLARRVRAVIYDL